MMTRLLEDYGQGGACFIDPSRDGIVYHNSFLLADPQEVWVLETVGKHWAAQQVTGENFHLESFYVYYGSWSVQRYMYGYIVDAIFCRWVPQYFK